MKEKRKFLRIYKSSLIKYKELDYPLQKRKYLNSSIKDISGNGLCFESEKEYGIGTVLHLLISLEAGKKKSLESGDDTYTLPIYPISIIGRVIRVESDPRDKFYNIGIKFIDFYQDEAANLIDFLNNDI